MAVAPGDGTKAASVRSRVLEDGVKNEFFRQRLRSYLAVAALTACITFVMLMTLGIPVIEP